MRILFYDGLTPFPYDAEIMNRQGIGGTESTVVRVAEGLSAMHDVAVAQRARQKRSSPHSGLRYIPLEDPAPFDGKQPDWVIVLRKHRHVPPLRKRFPSSAMISWIHNWQRAESAIQRIGLARNRCAVITVSDARRAATDGVINGPVARIIGTLSGGGGIVPVHRIYNPVDERLAPNDTPVDPNKLTFFSTANKGLNQVLTTFTAVRKAIPSLRLYIAGESLESLETNPRYDSALTRQPGVHLLGRLPQREIFQHVRESLCVFYPQNQHPETFGLVFAESNALGTPVIAHDFGSAREILGGDEQLVNADDHRSILTKLLDWHQGKRPNVFLNPKFRTPSVVEQWNRFFNQALGAGKPPSTCQE